MRALVLLLFAGSAFGQTFDVASIRATAPGERGGRRGGMPQSIGMAEIAAALSGGADVQTTPESLTMRGTPLAACIAWAYQVEIYRVTGPDWIKNTRFDIAAKAAAPTTDKEMRVMLQHLLADRFKLTLHRQTRELEGFVLSVAKGGHKLKESQSDEPAVFRQNGIGAIGTNAPISEIIPMLSQAVGMPVTDLTGLKGKYDFRIDLAPYLADVMGNRQPGDAPPDPIAIGTLVLQEQLGLKLEARKAPVEVLVVDNVEKVPTEN
jgi:uncharacterized protein (TIGR03435 family)